MRKSRDLLHLPTRSLGALRCQVLARSRGPNRLTLYALLVAILIIGESAVGMAEGTPSPTVEQPPVVRETLVAANPELSPSHLLELVRYTIQPDTTLSPHTHPGTQIAWIESGVLHYVVVEGGEIAVTRASGPGTPGPIEYLGPGEETDLYPGDSVVETSEVVHYGANLGTEPVVILASTLLVTDLPAAILAATPTAP